MLAQRPTRIHVHASTSGLLAIDSDEYKALVAAAELDFSQADKVADYLSEAFFTNVTPDFDASTTFELSPYPSERLMEAVVDALTSDDWTIEEDRCLCHTCKDSSVGTLYMKPPYRD